MEIKLVGSSELENKINKMINNIEPDKRRILFGKSTSLLKNYLQKLYDEELKTSKIKNKLFTYQDSESGKLYTDQIHAAFLEYGTKPHDIFPKRKNALSWYIGSKPKPQGYMGNPGSWALAKHVRHPGTKPKYFFKRTLEDNETKILEIFKRGIEDV